MRAKSSVCRIERAVDLSETKSAGTDLKNHALAAGQLMHPQWDPCNERKEPNVPGDLGTKSVENQVIQVQPIYL